MCINNAKANERVLFDSEMEIPYSQYVEWCEANDIAPEAEYSDAYWRYVDDQRQEYLYDFRGGMIQEKLFPMVVRADVHTWRVVPTTGYLVVNDTEELLAVFQKCDRVKIYQDGTGLHMDGYHHDGTNRAELRTINKRGKAFFERNDGVMENGELFKKLSSTFYSKALPIGKTLV